jgi:hypothetical protein
MPFEVYIVLSLKLKGNEVLGKESASTAYLIGIKDPLL